MGNRLQRRWVSCGQIFLFGKSFFFTIFHAFMIQLTQISQDNLIGQHWWRPAERAAGSFGPFQSSLPWAHPIHPIQHGLAVGHVGPTEGKAPGMTMCLWSSPVYLCRY
jgi:hypothetical protein